MVREKSFREILADKMAAGASPEMPVIPAPPLPQGSPSPLETLLVSAVPAGLTNAWSPSAKTAYPRPRRSQRPLCVLRSSVEGVATRAPNGRSKTNHPRPLELLALSTEACFALEVFRRLGVELEFPLRLVTLKRAYRHLAHQLHPDRANRSTAATSPATSDAFLSLKEAYEILLAEFTTPPDKAGASSLRDAA